RHEVRRELDALGIEAQHLAQGLHQQGLGEPGHADQQRMAAAEQRHQPVLAHLLLPKDDGACGLADALETLSGWLNASEDGFVSVGECAHELRPIYAPRSSLRNCAGKDDHNMMRMASVLKSMSSCRIIAQDIGNEIEVEGM